MAVLARPAFHPIKEVATATEESRRRRWRWRAGGESLVIPGHKGGAVAAATLA